ncbi:thiol peroxidase [Aeromonas jandaei]|uniref:thiol peroxidase n=1 Tax=Aeromonas jandaei TaxID=650 RepID=UPI002AA0CE76|nr:thiol peroxidase [Aeromonas jandaei]
MSQIVTIEGNEVTVSGYMPVVGSIAPSFFLVTSELSDVGLDSYGGLRKILNIFPSIDTTTCANSVREFNALASKLENTVVMCISADLPFAQSRFCGVEGIDKVVTLSTMRGADFMHDYGVAFTSGPLLGLAARAIVVLDEENKVIHSELVAEVTEEPNYKAVLAVL